MRYLAASCCVQSVSIGNMCSELSFVVWRRSSGVGKPRERGAIVRKADSGKPCGGRAVQRHGMAAREGNVGAGPVWEGSEARLRSAGAARDGGEARLWSPECWGGTGGRRGSASEVRLAGAAPDGGAARRDAALECRGSEASFW